MMSSSSHSLIESSPEAVAAFLDELAHVCRAAAKGDLEPRIMDIPDEQHLAETAFAVNSLLDSTDAFVRESAASLKAASEMRFYRKFIEQGMPGAFGRGAGIITGAQAAMAQQSKATEDARKSRVDVCRDLQVIMDDASDRIDNVVGEIDRIMNGIKVLSLNALIEAARAGEAGRGFSVVAGEVKAMADRIGNSMGRIREEIKAFRAESDRVIRESAEHEGDSCAVRVA